MHLVSESIKRSLKGRKRENNMENKAYKKTSGLFWYPMEKVFWESLEMGKGDTICQNTNIKPLQGENYSAYAFFKHLEEAAFLAKINQKQPMVYALIALKDVKLTRLPRKEPDEVIDKYRPVTYIAKDLEITSENFKILDVVHLQ